MDKLCLWKDGNLDAPNVCINLLEASLTECRFVSFYDEFSEHEFTTWDRASLIEHHFGNTFEKTIYRPKFELVSMKVGVLHETITTHRISPREDEDGKEDHKSEQEPTDNRDYRQIIERINKSRGFSF